MKCMLGVVVAVFSMLGVVAPASAQSDDVYSFEQISQRDDLFFETAVKTYAYDLAARGMADRAACATATIFADPLRLRQTLAQFWALRTIYAPRLVVRVLDILCAEGKPAHEARPVLWRATEAATLSVSSVSRPEVEVDATLRLLLARASEDGRKDVETCIGSTYQALYARVLSEARAAPGTLVPAGYAMVQAECGYAQGASAPGTDTIGDDLAVARERRIAIRDFMACESDAADDTAREQCQKVSNVQRLDQLGLGLTVLHYRQMPRDVLEINRSAPRLPDGRRIVEVERDGNWMYLDGERGPVDPIAAATRRPASGMSFDDLMALMRGDLDE